jgi:carboxyl-terminal processing protease
VTKNLLKKLIIPVFIVVIAVAGSYYLGFQHGLDQTKNIVIKNVTDSETPSNVTANFSLFWEVWNKLKTEHIDGAETSDQNLMYGAIKGLTGALGDPNTVFFTPDESKKFNEDIRGSFGGIGAEIGMRDGNLTIVAPLENSPAKDAGLKAGDTILQIDGNSTADMTIDDAVKEIRGDPGTVVTLTILREGSDSSQKIEITRAIISVPTVKWEMIDGDIIHLNLFSFSQNSATDFQKAMIQALLQGGNGLILDLRGNPGGFLDVAVRIAGFFVDRGDVVATERFTSGDEKVLRATGNAALKDLPVVVLVDNGSASASEILAGALRVDNGTKIVGVKSFGKGTVQELENLSDDSTLKITIANWLLPNGDLIQGNGLEPDINVEITSDDVAAGKDPQLDAAVNLLKSEMK